MREKTVEIENMFLSPYAKKSEDTLGRARKKNPVPCARISSATATG